MCVPLPSLLYLLQQVGRSAPIVETRVLNDPEELDRRLSLLQNGYTPAAIPSVLPPVATTATTTATANGHPAPPYTNGDAETMARVSTMESLVFFFLRDDGSTVLSLMIVWMNTIDDGNDYNSFGFLLTVFLFLSLSST